MKIKIKDNVTKLKAKPSDGLYSKVSTLATMTDTGNGYIFKFPSYSSVVQTDYVCIDYAQAEYMFKLLETVKDKFE